MLEFYFKNQFQSSWFSIRSPMLFNRGENGSYHMFIFHVPYYHGTLVFITVLSKTGHNYTLI